MIAQISLCFRRALRGARKGVLLLLAASIPALTAASVMAAELIVVESRGVALKPGQKVDAATSLSLPEGARLTLISPNGDALKLRGPWQGVLAAPAGAESVDVASALSLLVSRKQARVGEAGIVRAGFELRLPEPWVIDPLRPGSICVREKQPVVLWRAATERESSVIVRPADRSWIARGSWEAGSDRLELPTSMPRRDRLTYLMSVDGKEVPLVLSIVPDVLESDRGRAAWMVEKGCDAQAEALLGRR